MSVIHYNDVVKKAIKNLSTSTNVLEKYDNVTYNITFYMYDYNIEKEIDENIIKNGGFITDTKDSEKIIIAQSGRTVNFVINSLLIKTVYGTLSPVNVQSNEIRLKIKEPMGANFTNALDITAKALGYPTHLERPYWIDVYFTGYDHKTLERVEKIKLDGDLDTLTFRCMPGEVKSNVDRLGTTWDITLVPYHQKLTNKNSNYLSITNEFKADTHRPMDEIIESLVEMMKEDYIKTFRESEQEKVKSYLNSNKYIELEYRFSDSGNVSKANGNENGNESSDSNNIGNMVGSYYGKEAGAAVGGSLGGPGGADVGGYIGKKVGDKFGGKVYTKIEKNDKTGILKGTNKLLGGGGLLGGGNSNNSDSKSGSNNKIKNVKLDSNTSGDDTKNEQMVIKAEPDEYFTTFIQKLFTRVKGDNKAYVVSYEILPKAIKLNNDIVVNTYKVILNFYKDPIIKEAVMKTYNYDEASKIYLNESINNRSLFKKYIFGFSGIDTSVLEVHNIYDMLWYTMSIDDSVRNFNETNINLKRSTEKNNNKSNNKSNNDMPNNSNNAYNGPLKINSRENTELGKLFGDNSTDLSSSMSNAISENLGSFSTMDNVKNNSFTNNELLNIGKAFENYNGSSSISSEDNLLGKVDNNSSAATQSYGNIKSYLKQNKYVEDMFYDKYEEYIKNIFNDRIEIPVRNNKLNNIEQKLASSSESGKYDEQAIISEVMFNKLYQSGKMTNTKFTIIADPYWLIPTCVVPINSNIQVSNIMEKLPGSQTFKCVFELRTMYKQVKNYKNESAGYIDETQTLGADYAMNNSLNVSGIYMIHSCETKLEDGKFTQTLSGTLDDHFLSDF